MIQAISDKIVVESMRVGKTEAGIIIPDSGSDSVGYGKIISIGDDIPKTIVTVGNILVFHPRAGMDNLINETLLKVLKYEEVYGILTDKDIINTLTPIVIGKKAQDPSIVTGGGGVVIAP